MTIAVRFINADGTETLTDVENGLSMMEAAVAAGVEGIIGECGGNLACATCHCWIASEWREKLGQPSEFELAMLDCALNVTEDSRLGCQVVARSELDGMTVRVPPVS